VVTGEPSTDFEDTISETNCAFGFNLSDMVFRPIFDGRKCLRELPVTGLIASGRNSHLQGLMRTFTVVDVSPPVVVVLAVVKTVESLPGDEFVLECSVKAFVLAKSLWMTHA